MQLTERLDDYGKPAWIAVMILGFVVFWPLGLAILAFLIGSGRMGCKKRRGVGRWHHAEKNRWRFDAGEWFAGQRARQGSGNSAFDEYREETLRRLEDEQKEFMDFLERLRHAKDKAEFDQFMAERKHPREGAASGEAPEPQPGA